MTQRGSRSNKSGGASTVAPARSADDSLAPPAAGAAGPSSERTPGAITGGTAPDGQSPSKDADDCKEQSAGPGANGQPVDVVYLHEPNEAGDGYQVLRQRRERLELGEIRPIREGRPIQGEIVRLTPRQEGSRLFDVDVLYEPPRAPAHAGPARVATEKYRHGWDDVFGRPNERKRGGEGGVN